MPNDGPIPKRSSQRRRRNKENLPETVKVAGLPVKQPPADDEWHPIARDWYESLAESGQARFFEPSDWRSARYVAEAMSTNLNAGRFSAQLFAAVWSAMGELLSTEGARRRARMEIERETDESAQEIVDINAYRSRAG